MYGRFLHKAVRYWLGGGIRKENSNYSSGELGTISEKRTFKAPDVSEPIHTVTTYNPTEPISWGKKEDYSLYLLCINDI